MADRGRNVYAPDYGIDRKSSHTAKTVADLLPLSRQRAVRCAALADYYAELARGHRALAQALEADARLSTAMGDG